MELHHSAKCSFNFVTVPKTFLGSDVRENYDLTPRGFDKSRYLLDVDRHLVSTYGGCFQSAIVSTSKPYLCRPENTKLKARKI